MSTLTLESRAKLNLYLRVDGLRADGYHQIETVFERVSLSDTITLTSTANPDIRIRCRAPGVPVDERNLCYRAAARLKEYCKISAGCEIRLVKRIPPGSGMGGGSSNAATTLMGLRRLWRLKIPSSELAAIAAGIGSDVPFFLSDARFASARGRGERLRPLGARGPALHHVIIVPRVHASTKEIYEGWDRMHDANRNCVGTTPVLAPDANRNCVGTTPVRRLTRASSDVTMIFSALKRKDLRSLCGALRNDLERVTGNRYPAIYNAKKQLSQEPGIAGVLMTGSGSAVFGIFESKKAAQSCARRLSTRAGRVFYAETA